MSVLNKTKFSVLASILLASNLTYAAQTENFIYKGSNPQGQALVDKGFLNSLPGDAEIIFLVPAFTFTQEQLAGSNNVISALAVYSPSEGVISIPKGLTIQASVIASKLPLGKVENTLAIGFKSLSVSDTPNMSYPIGGDKTEQATFYVALPDQSVMCLDYSNAECTQWSYLGGSIDLKIDALPSLLSNKGYAYDGKIGSN